MALQFNGPDVALVRQDRSGKWDLDISTSGPNNGNPRTDSSRTHAVLTTLLSWKRGKRPGPSSPEEGGYYYDATGRRGTLLWTVTQDRLATPSQLQAYAEDGGQQLINLHYLASFKASASRRARGKLVVTVQWTLPSGTAPPPVSL